ncbi:LysR family transcriptional regulator [Actinocrispum wychmicini]|uniref:DNA-binding transcriptional LysR family regulator n=1 Tax=Actinocrispum wychmicini TaxID=1213861 RepID=A0A4R2JRG4_9PSEU|nr:LysR family transcriptional regulator [Actinocrispum wychmicini]TCO59808.1 DNA-binding transcriptional LysR family regulator [Actinocrispum wychmicini]
MADIEVRELRYFHAVAEQLNFTRAAEVLGMAQPPLSRAIRQLERRLDAQLFDRDGGRVTLTTAGQVLLQEADRVLDAVSAAALRTRRAAQPTPTLVVTAKPGVATDLLRQITAACAELPEPLTIETVVSGYGEQANLVRTGRSDVALVGSPDDHTGLDLEPMITEPRVAALPADHPLARRTTLICQDLIGLPTPQCPPGTPAAMRDYWAGMDRVLSPTIVPNGPLVRDSAQLLETVALGQAVALIPTSLADRNRRPDIAYRPVRDASPYTLAIAWRSGVNDPSIARLVRIAIDLTSDRAIQAAGLKDPKPRLVGLEDLRNPG